MSKKKEVRTIKLSFTDKVKKLVLTILQKVLIKLK